jgi:hypothetical protein
MTHVKVLHVVGALQVLTDVTLASAAVRQQQQQQQQQQH